MRILLLVTLLASTALSQIPPSETPQQSLVRAHTELQEGRITDAFAILQQLTTIQPPVKGLQHELGIAYYRTGKLEEAQRAFAAAAKEDPSDLESVQMEGLTSIVSDGPERLFHSSSGFASGHRTRTPMPTTCSACVI